MSLGSGRGFLSYLGYLLISSTMAPSGKVAGFTLIICALERSGRFLPPFPSVSEELVVLKWGTLVVTFFKKKRQCRPKGKSIEVFYTTI